MRAYRAILDATRPAGYWPLGDAGPGGLGFSTFGTPAWRNRRARPTSIGPGPDFGGSSYLEIPDDPRWSAPGSAGLSVSCWVIVDAFTSAAMFVAKGTDNNFEWRLNTHTDAGVYWVITRQDQAAESSIATAPGILTAGRPFFVCATWNGATGTGSVYVNGAPVAAGVPGFSMKDGSAPVQIGRRADGGGTVLDGVISDVAIHGKALDPPTVALLYRGGFGPRRTAA